MKYTVASVLTIATSLAAVRLFVDGSCTGSTSYSGDNATVTYTVTAPSGQAVKDCHWVPGKGSKLKNPTGTSTVPATGGWTMNGVSSNTQQVATASGDGIAAGTSGTFSFTFPMGGDSDSHKTKFAQSLRQCTFTATSDGTTTITTGNTVFTSGPTTGGPHVSWPISFVDIKDPPTTTVARIGTTIAIDIETTFYGGQSFKLHASTALSTTANGSDNPLGVGLDTTQAVPSSWGLTFSPLLDRSTLFIEREADRDDAVINVTIPNDSNLVGQVFYLCVSCSTSGSGSRDIFSQPLRITIRDSGSTSSSLELLPYSF